MPRQAMIRRDKADCLLFPVCASPDYARDLNPSEMWAQKKSRSSLI